MSDTMIAEPKLVDADKIAGHVREILKELGEDPDREGLAKTPERFAKALRFLTSGYKQDPKAPLPGRPEPGLVVRVRTAGPDIDEARLRGSEVSLKAIKAYRISDVATQRSLAAHDAAEITALAAELDLLQT